MSEFVTNDDNDMFGKYCKIQTGCSRTEHVYKIVKRIESNTYCDVPLYSGQTEEITHKDTVPVLLVIHCGVYESEVIRVPLAVCKICDEPDGWINVSDRLPNSYKDVIVCSETREVYCGWYAPVSRIWHNMDGAEIESVTHWRELPDPPRKLKE